MDEKSLNNSFVEEGNLKAILLPDVKFIAF